MKKLENNIVGKKNKIKNNKIIENNTNSNYKRFKILSCVSNKTIYYFTTGAEQAFIK